MQFRCCCCKSCRLLPRLVTAIQRFRRRLMQRPPQRERARARGANCKADGAVNRLEIAKGSGSNDDGGAADDDFEAVAPPPIRRSLCAVRQLRNGRGRLLLQLMRLNFSPRSHARDKSSYSAVFSSRPVCKLSVNVNERGARQRQRARCLKL